LRKYTSPPTELAKANLLREGIPPHKIHLTGNTIVDVVLKYKTKARREAEKILGELGFKKYDYILATVHRAENTNNKRRLKSILKALNYIADQVMPVIFPIHPRTQKLTKKHKIENLLDNRNITLIKPLGYFEFLGLLSYSHIVLTDSGRVQEEALTLKTPCITLRYSTEG